MAEAITLFKQALALDPAYAEAAASIALAMFRVTYSPWGSIYGLPTSIESQSEAERYVDMALSLDSQSALAHTVKALTIYFTHHDFEAAVNWAKKSVALSPNNADAYLGLAMILIRGGEPERSVEHLERAYQLDPENEVQIKLWLGDAYFGMEQYARAAEHTEQARKAAPENMGVWMALTAIYGQLDNTARAAAVETLNALRKANFQPKINEFYLNNLLAFTLLRYRYDEDRFRQGLLKAGILK